MSWGKGRCVGPTTLLPTPCLLRLLKHRPLNSQPRGNRPPERRSFIRVQHRSPSPFVFNRQCASPAVSSYPILRSHSVSHLLRDPALEDTISAMHPRQMSDWPNGLPLFHGMEDELDAKRIAGSLTLNPGPGLNPRLGAGLFRIAIVLNSYHSRLLPAIRRSYQRTIGAVAPDAHLAFYEPANRPGDFPNPDYFDLIVIGGGNVDPRKRYHWILQVHDFIRRVVRDRPNKKLLGICWGHQTICSLFGGRIVDAAVPEMGVSTVDLTSKGQEFFPEVATSRSFKLQQHHRREVDIAPQGFVTLGHNNQCLISESNTILTFQGHPEKDTETARLRLHDSTRWFGFDALSDEKAWAQLENLMNTPHDGEMVWRRIFQWVQEPPAAPRGVQLMMMGDPMLDSHEAEKPSKI